MQLSCINQYVCIEIRLSCIKTLQLQSQCLIHLNLFTYLTELPTDQLNITVQETTGCISYELVFGQAPRQATVRKIAEEQDIIDPSMAFKPY